MFTKTIDTLKPKQTVCGPGGIKLHLDADQVFPDDPGQGTPCMIQIRKGWATLWCASDYGEIGEENATAAQTDWMHNLANEADQWLDHWTNVKRGEYGNAGQ